MSTTELKKYLSDRLGSACALHVADEVTSTMDVARTLTVAPNSYGLCSANRQSKGRGRQGRLWDTTDGAVAITFAHHVDPQWNVTGLTLVVGLVVAESIRALSRSSEFVLKWPNDVLGSFGGKVSGVLLERNLHEGKLYTGIGINLSRTPDVGAASVFSVSGVHLDQGAVIVDLAERVNQAFAVHREQGFSAFFDRWTTLGPKPGTLISVKREGVFQEGKYQGITRKGQLLMIIDGATKIIDTAEVAAA